MVRPGRRACFGSRDTATGVQCRTGGVRREGSRPMKRLLGALALGGLMTLTMAAPSALAQSPYGGYSGYGGYTGGYGGLGAPTYTGAGVPTFGGVYPGSYGYGGSTGAYGAPGYGPLPSSYG